MNYRQSNLLAATSITTAGTYVLDLNVQDVISRINVIVRLTNSSWTPTGHPALVVTQMDLVDGADSLFSMRGVYAQAVAWYQTKIQPFNYINYTDNGLAVASCPIWFGRYLYDPELALDPKRFTNLQLKIQHNYLAGGAVPDAATLEVWADLFDEKPVSPRGFLSSKSHWTKTLVASTTDYVELPTDYPIRLVMPAAFSNSEEPDINIDNIKITEDFDRKIVLEAGTLELLQMYENAYPVFQEYGEGRTLAANNVSFFVTPCKDVQLSAQPSQDTDNYINFPWSGGNSRYIMGSATSTIQLGIIGRCPHGVIPIPMGRQDMIEDWWDVTKLGSARIKMVTGAGDTSAYYELLLQQLRS
jgi:hypothetical protein